MKAVGGMSYCSLMLDVPLQILLKLWALKRMQIVACSKSLQQKKMEIVGFPKRLKQRRMAIARFSSMLLGMSTESLKHYLACSLCARRDKIFDPNSRGLLYRIWLADVLIVSWDICSYNCPTQIERALRGRNLRCKKSQNVQKSHLSLHRLENKRFEPYWRRVPFRTML